MSGSPTRSRRPRVAVVVESDLPHVTGLLPWERDLLLPIVQKLVHEALAASPPEDQTAGEHDAEDVDDEA